MTKQLLVIIALLAFGASVANAAPWQNANASQQQGDNTSTMVGGGG